jgi:hypothetical protein
MKFEETILQVMIFLGDPLMSALFVKVSPMKLLAWSMVSV